MTNYNATFREARIKFLANLYVEAIILMSIRQIFLLQSTHAASMLFKQQKLIICHNLNTFITPAIIKNDLISSDEAPFRI